MGGYWGGLSLNWQALMAVDADALTIWEDYNMATGLGVTRLLVKGDSSLIPSCTSHLFGKEVY